MKYLAIFFLVSTTTSFFSCSSKTPDPTSSDSLPAISLDNKYIIRGMAVYDLKKNGTTASLQLVQKSFATGPQLDIVDVSVVNAPNTQFQISPDTKNQGIVSGTLDPNGYLLSPDATIGIEIAVSNLKDNNLFICTEGTKCDQAVIRIYTIDDNVHPSGLANFANLTGATVPIGVNSSNAEGSILSTVLPFGSANAIPIASVDLSSHVSLTQNDFSVDGQGGPVFQLTSNFAGAASGSYSARVVFEYDLVGPVSIAPTYSNLIVLPLPSNNLNDSSSTHEVRGNQILGSVMIADPAFPGSGNNEGIVWNLTDPTHFVLTNPDDTSGLDKPQHIGPMGRVVSLRDNDSHIGSKMIVSNPNSSGGYDQIICPDINTTILTPNEIMPVPIKFSEDGNFIFANVFVQSMHGQFEPTESSDEVYSYQIDNSICSPPINSLSLNPIFLSSDFSDYFFQFLRNGSHVFTTNVLAPSSQGYVLDNLSGRFQALALDTDGNAIVSASSSSTPNDSTAILSDLEVFRVTDTYSLPDLTVKASDYSATNVSLVEVNSNGDIALSMDKNGSNSQILFIGKNNGIYSSPISLPFPNNFSVSNYGRQNSPIATIFINGKGDVLLSYYPDGINSNNADYHLIIWARKEDGTFFDPVISAITSINPTAISDNGDIVGNEFSSNLLVGKIIRRN